MTDHSDLSPRGAGKFTVNMLAQEHQHLAAQFARSGTEKFAGVDHCPSPLGNPVLPEALASTPASGSPRRTAFRRRLTTAGTPPDHGRHSA